MVCLIVFLLLLEDHINVQIVDLAWFTCVVIQYISLWVSIGLNM